MIQADGTSPQSVARHGVEILLSAAAAVLKAAGSGGRDQIAPGEVLALAAGPTRQVALNQGIRAFLPVGLGWMSIALAGREDRIRLEAALGALGAEWKPKQGIVGTTNSPNELATWLQELGLAALPAYAVAPQERIDLALGSPNPFERPRWAVAPGAPLKGLTVVELGLVASSPHAGAVFQDLGATVHTVSHQTRALSRWHGPDPVLLDLTTVDGRHQFGELCRGADVVIDNFRERAWGNLHLDPLGLGAHIHLRLPAFPAVDPRSTWRAFGFQMEAMFGAGSAPTSLARTVVAAPPIALLDHATGFAGVAAAIRRLGVGGRVEVSQVDVATGCIGW